MPEGSLLFHLMSALVAALIGATVASLLRQSVVVGYLLAGIVIGPFTPGFMGDVEAVQALAEVGVVFLMFVIGVQMSASALVRAGRSALVGGVLQVLSVLGLGWLVGRALGLSSLDALFLGAVVSNSSSTVLSKVLTERGEQDTSHARLGLAWSSVQDVSATAFIALLPVVTASRGAQQEVLSQLGKALVFLLALVPLAFIVLPRMLHHLGRLGNRELFALAASAIALAMAYTASLLGVSVALGAFLAGVVIGESDLSHHVVGGTAPLRDVFSGIFFVSVGMMMDPMFVVSNVARVLAGVAVIMLLKGAVTLVLARLTGSPLRMSVLVGLGLAQSGEFSFLIAQAGLSLGAISRSAFDLAVSSAVLSVLLYPALYRFAPPVLHHWLRQRPAQAHEEPRRGEAPPPSGHAIICGFGRVGRVVAKVLDHQGLPYVVIEEDLRTAQAARRAGATVVVGDSAEPHVLDSARAAAARVVIACIPERMAVRRIVDHARRANPDLRIVARTHSAEEHQRIRRQGATDVVLGEQELALEMARRALAGFSVEALDAESTLDEVRQEQHRP